jgi:hypothetical protein
MESPGVRGSGRAPPIRRQLVQGKQMMQPPVARPTQPRPKTTSEGRSG